MPVGGSIVGIGIQNIFVKKQDTSPPIPPSYISKGIMDTCDISTCNERLPVSSAEWNGVAMLFKLSPLQQNYTNSVLYVQFYTYTPAISGYRYRLGLYRYTSDNDLVLVAASNIKSSLGAGEGYKTICLQPYLTSSISLSTSDRYAIGLFTDAFNNNGQFEFKCKPDILEEDASHITSPSGAYVDTPLDQLANISHSNWAFGYNIWFSVSLIGSEVLP